LKNFCFEQINLKTISKRDLKTLLTKRLKVSPYIKDFDKVNEIIKDNFDKKDFIRVSKKELEKIIFK